MPDDLSPKEGLYPFRDWSMEMKRSVSPSISVLSGASYGRTWLPSAVLTMRSMGHQLYQNCQSHLDMPETLPPRCDLLIFRWAPLSAECYPFCLRHSKLSASQRLYLFFNRSRGQEHVQSHIRALDAAKATNCPHPQCILSFDSVQDLEHHL